MEEYKKGEGGIIKDPELRMSNDNSGPEVIFPLDKLEPFLKASKLKKEYLKRKAEPEDLWWAIAAGLLFLTMIFLAGFFTHKLLS